MSVVAVMMLAASAAAPVPSGLTAEQVEGYLAGGGMGMARPAELHSYPGPKHVLELGEELELDAEQRAAVERIEARMREVAIELGRRIVAAERDLDALFASGEVDEPRLLEAVGGIARLQGELRAVHLAAHLQTRRVLTPEQVREYDRLRGHGAKPATDHGRGRHSP